MYSMGRELKKLHEINLEFGLNCVTFRGSSLTDRRLAVGDFGGRVYSYDFEENKEVWGLRGHEVSGTCLQRQNSNVAVASRVR